jgi:signal transduction histidine kinase
MPAEQMPNAACALIADVADLGRRALAGGDPQALFGPAVQMVSRHLHVPFSSLFELLPDGRASLQAGVGWPLPADCLIAQEIAPDSLPGLVMGTQTDLAISDLRKSPHHPPFALFVQHRIVSSLLVPICSRNRTLGAIGAHDVQPREFSAEEVATLHVIANVLAAALDHKWHGSNEYAKQLLRAEQMMAIGQVAAGVAHELRNPLTSIKGLIQVNLRELESQSVAAHDLRVIEQEIRRMEKTLQNFLDFARPPKPDREQIDFAAIVDRIISLVGGRARKQAVELVFLQPESPVEAEVDQDQVQQLVLNLVLNALDALPDGGTIELDLRTPRDGFLELYVRDTGPGIAPEILPKIFETFVSSKETGIGLGVPLSLRIAEDHGGTLTAFNLPGQGACFLLRLPVRSHDL